MFSTNKKQHNSNSSFDVRESAGPISLLKLLIFISFLIAILIICLKVYQGGVREKAEPPTIVGDRAPFKVILEEPGGVETPDQDKTIYSVMEADIPNINVTPKEVVESPIDFSKIVTESSVGLPQKLSSSKVEAINRVSPVLSSSDNIKTSGPGYIKTAPNLTSDFVIQMASVRSKETAEYLWSDPNLTSDFVIQMASVRSKEAAEYLWSDIKTKHKDLFYPDLYHNIKIVDLGNKGIYYRLRVAGFTDKVAAGIFCEKLKDLNQACFVTRK